MCEVKEGVVVGGVYGGGGMEETLAQEFQVGVAGLVKEKVAPLAVVE